MEPNIVPEIVKTGSFMSSETIAAWIAAGVAIISTAATVIAGIITRHLDNKQGRKREVMRIRQDALLKALEVIDHVYANSKFDGLPPSQPHDWPIADARSAMNQMIIYCANPQKTVGLFHKAIGLHNPGTQSAPQYGPKDLDAFRKAVTEELELSELKFENANRGWICKLPGGK